MGGIVKAFTGVIGDAFGAIAEGEAQSQRAADIQADMLDSGRLVGAANRKEVEAIEQGRWESGATRMKASQMIAQQRVAAANSGVDTQSGTAADVMANTRMMSELDAQQQKNNAYREAWGHRQEAETQSRKTGRLRQKLRANEDAGLLSRIGLFVESAGNNAGNAAGGMGG